MSHPDAAAEINDAFEAWVDANYDSVLRSWTEHLSEMQDSREHIVRLANSDDAFKEYAFELYHNYIVEVASAERGDEPDGAA